MKTTKRTGILMLLVLLLAGCAMPSGGSPRGWVNSNYTKESSNGDSAVYTSPKPPKQVVNDLTGAWRPAEKRADAAGYFLRYSNLIVGVVPSGTGSKIYLDDERRGYSRWYPYVGGYWGTYTGPGEGFRGGGPGAGK